VTPTDLGKKMKQLKITEHKRPRIADPSEDSGYDSLDEVFKRQKRKSFFALTSIVEANEIPVPA
jgi:hypothetical protein